MNRPILKNRTIMKQFKNDASMTLDIMAENYGMPLDEFLENVKRVCGRENFADLQKLNNKRLKAGKGKPIIINPEEEDEEMKAMIREDLKRQKEERIANTKIKSTKEDKPMEKNVEKLQERLEVVTTIVSSIDSQLVTLNAIQEATQIELAELEQKVNTLKQEQAERSIEIQKKMSELENTKAEQAQLQKELDCLTKVILIAPKYWGKLPNNRKMISSVARGNDSEGVKVEKVPKEEWLSQPSIEKMMVSGYDSLEKYLEAFEFVQLVLKYQLDGKPYELKAQEKIVEMIKAEGGEV